MESLTERHHAADYPVPPAPSRNGGPPGGGRPVAPLIAVAVAFFVGMAVARLLDWRTHAHPRT